MLKQWAIWDGQIRYECTECGMDGLKDVHFCKVEFHRTMQSIAESLEKIANPPIVIKGVITEHGPI